jgi:hypothetical protein
MAVMTEFLENMPETRRASYTRGGTRYKLQVPEKANLWKLRHGGLKITQLEF